MSKVIQYSNRTLPPWPILTTILQAYLDVTLPDSVLQKGRSTNHLCWATTYWAHQSASTRMLSLQHGKRCIHSWHDYHWLLLFNVALGNPSSKFWQQALQVVKYTILLQSQTCAYTVFQATEQSRFFTLIFETQKQCKRQAYQSWTFHLHITLPPSSSTLEGSLQLSQD